MITEPWIITTFHLDHQVCKIDISFMTKQLKKRVDNYYISDYDNYYVANKWQQYNSK